MVKQEIPWVRFATVIPLVLAAACSAAEASPRHPTPFPPLASTELARRSGLRGFDAAALLDGGEILLDLPDGRAVLARPRRIDGGGGTFSWLGTIPGPEGGDVLLSVHGGFVAGKAWAGDQVLHVRSSAPGEVVIEPVPMEDLGPCGTAGAGLRPWPGLPGGPDRPLPSDDGSIIDVLIAYTTVVDGLHPDIEAEIRFVIDETNLVYENSGIGQRLRLTATAVVDYAEPGNTQTDLDRLRTPGDGFLDELDVLRDAACADVVSLWVQNAGGLCGRASQMDAPLPSFESEAFTVCQVNCAIFSYSQAHELGHVMGAAHETGDTGSSGAFAYSHGYQHPAGAWRTVMATSNDCPGSPCRRVPHHSNPAVLRTGVPTGVPDEADVARTLNETAVVVSSFRESAGCQPCIEDEHEPDDACAIAPVQTGGTLRRHEHCRDEVDWIRFGAIAGESYTFETMALGPTSDTVVDLFDVGCGAPLASADEGGSEPGASLLDWVAPADGCYTVRVSQADGLVGFGRAYDFMLWGTTDDAQCCAGGEPFGLRVTKNEERAITWFAPPGGRYGLYRGEQDGLFAPSRHACFIPGLVQGWADDRSEPGGDGRWIYYLVGRTGPCSQGLGTDSLGTPRPNPAPCR